MANQQHIDLAYQKGTNCAPFSRKALKANRLKQGLSKGDIRLLARKGGFKWTLRRLQLGRQSDALKSYFARRTPGSQMRYATSGPVRHKALLTSYRKKLDVTQWIARRIARTGGVKKIVKSIVWPMAKPVLKHFLEAIITDSVTYCERMGRITVTAMDVVFALKRYGMHYLH